MNKKVRELIKIKGPLAENEVKDILKAYGINTTKYKLVNKIEDLDNLDLKFPVALKVCSNKILHKTDVGGVKLGIKDRNELKKSFKEFSFFRHHPYALAVAFDNGADVSAPQACGELFQVSFHVP